MIAELLSLRVRARTQNKNYKSCAYTLDNPYTLTRQNNVHNSLRIEFVALFQHFISKWHIEDTKEHKMHDKMINNTNILCFFNYC